MEEQNGDEVTEPQVFAHHCTEAGLAEKAVTWWLRAGRRAVSFSADAEAISHLKRGLALLDFIENLSSRRQLALELDLALVAPTISVHGYTSAELNEVLTRVLGLSGSTATRAIFPVLYGRLTFEVATGFLDQAVVHSREALNLARQLVDGEGIAIQQASLGSLLLFGGRIRSATKILERVLPELEQDKYSSSAFEYGQDMYALTAAYLSLAMWVGGRIDEAYRYRQRAFERAKALRHLNTSCIVQAFAGGSLGAICREPDRTKLAATELLKMASEHNLPVWSPTGTILLGQALAEVGHVSEGIAKMQTGISGLTALHIRVFRPLHASWLASACVACGLADEGRAALADCWSVSKGGEHWMDAELHRLEGEILLIRGNQHEAAERQFLRAIEIARRQCALAWESRARCSLARLLEAQTREAGRVSGMSR